MNARTSFPWQRSIASLVGVALLASASAQAIPIQWTTASGGNGHWYERIEQTGLTFTAARDAAATLSYLGLPGRLVVFETSIYSSELIFVRDNVYAPGVQSDRIYWVGASSPDGFNPWTWIDGATVPTSITSTWNIDRAEGAGAEGIGFFRPATTLWDYIQSNSSGYVSGFVVEYQPSAVPEVDPTGMGSVLALVTGALGLIERRRRQGRGKQLNEAMYAGSIAIAFLLLPIVEDIAVGGVVMYTSQAAFESASQNLTTVDFAGYTNGTSIANYGTPAGLTTGAIRFIGHTDSGGNWLYAIRPSYYPLSYDIWPTGASPAILQGPSGGGPAAAVGYLEVVASGSCAAIGSGLYVVLDGHPGGPAGSVNVIVTDGDGDHAFVVHTTAAPNIAFAGFISDHGITRVTYTSVGAQIYPNLSGFKYQSEGVPEIDPAGMGSVLALVTGGLGLLERRRLKVA